MPMFLNDNTDLDKFLSKNVHERKIIIHSVNRNQSNPTSKSIDKCIKIITPKHYHRPGNA